MQGGTNGSKEKSSKEESSKEENSKEESSKEESKEESSKEEEKISRDSLLFLTRPHGWVALTDSTYDHEVLFMGNLRLLCSLRLSLL